MRKLLTIIVYTIIVLLIGRNITGLPRFTLFSNPDSYPKELKENMQKLIDDKKGNYGISFLNLTNGDSFGINDKEIFTAASVNKVPIVAALYALENKGEIDFDEQITLQESDIQDYGTGSLRYKGAGGTYSLKTLAKLSLKESDNTAAYVLGKRIGTETIQKLMSAWGLTQTSIDENTTSPQDMQKLFVKIYRNEITSEGKTEEMLSFMTDTDIEDRIPALLEKDTKIAHKTGDAVGSLNDVGLIYHGSDVYFLAVLTSDIGDTERQTKQTIAKIAEDIVIFYDKRK